MLVTLDFETYYDTKVSLTKMSTMEYVRHPMFKVWGVGIKIDDGEPEWFSEDDVTDALMEVCWDDASLLCQNTPFDGYILSQVYGILPKFYLDTAAMSRGLFPGQSSSLKAIAERLFPEDEEMRKGDDLVKAKGLVDLPPDVEADLARYCLKDVELTYEVYQRWHADYPPSELALIDLTTRMFCDPVIKIDRERLSKYHESEYERAQKLIEDSGIERQVLTSNDKFAEHLRSLGITPPTKVSPATGELIPAFGKNDAGWRQLCKMYPEHQHLWSARIAAKSRIAETRAKRFLDAAGDDDRISVPLRYYAAHTGRFGGTEKLNMQNLPRGGELRKCLIAPEGSLIYVADLSNIEARMLAWLAGQVDLLDQFRSGEDIYSNFASKIYSKPISKNDNPTERFVGKTCLGETTRILTNNGVKRIIDVSFKDMVWDGVEWVSHSGLLYQGTSNVMDLLGVSITPDHKIYTGRTWTTAECLEQDEFGLSQALEHAQENLPLQVTLGENGVAAKASLSYAPATVLNSLSIPIISRILKALDVTLVQSLLLLKNAIGLTQKQWPMTDIGLDYSTDCHPQSPDAIPRRTQSTQATASVEYLSTKIGEKIKLRFFDMSKQSLAGMTRLLRWTASTITPVTNQATSGLRQGEKTSPTGAKSIRFQPKSKNLRPVYDISNAGPRHRFTIITDKGPLIVHNCVLGLGYGMGHHKFQHTMASGASGPPINLSDSEALRIVRLYRSSYGRIPVLWARMEALLRQSMNPINEGVTYRGVLTVTKNGLLLPNGMALRYEGLRVGSGDSLEYVSKGKKEVTYGGRITENVIQALARIVITDSMLRLAKRFQGRGRVALTVHDEVVIIAANSDPDATMNEIIDDLCQPPSWAPDLPLAAEGGYDTRYSK